ncbi:MAG: class I SAM-dependent methyltransferase, partial [Waddliaceae bacterium]|nr:class I SAM-dependent methyltransferase [Waddliaceae bacterium]
MSQFGDLYAGYYDLLYNDKDYKAEAKFVDSLIKKYNATANTMLDVGCGTGKHAEIFADMGYAVHGIDLSEDMLAIARKQSKSDNVTFSKADVTAMKLDEKYDTIVSLFHVMSYQTTNEALIKAF